MAESSTKRLSDDSTLHESDRFAFIITRLAPGHSLLTLFGYNDGAIADGYYRALEEELDRAGELTVYMDARQQRGISAEERDRTARWTKTLGDAYRGSHLLFRSRLLDLAAAIVNIAVGGRVTTYSNVERFESAIRERVPGFERLPTFSDSDVSRWSA